MKKLIWILAAVGLMGCGTADELPGVSREGQPCSSSSECDPPGGQATCCAGPNDGTSRHYCAATLPKATVAYALSCYP
jgi:hypothetical protein